MNRINSTPTFLANNGRSLLIRLNRLLAWGLLLSPVIQILLGTGFGTSVAFLLVLLVIHALLSFVLFDKSLTYTAPERSKSNSTTGEQSNWRVTRNKFFKNASRIFIGLLAPFLFFITALPFMFAVGAKPSLGLLFIPLTLVILYFNALFILSILRHVRDASSYAFRRSWLPRSDALWLGWWTMWVFAALSMINLFKGFWL